MRTLRQLFIAALLPCFSTFAASELKTTARLILSAETVKPGDTVMAGIVMQMEKGWHTYWRNPGEEFGFPTTIKWRLPKEISAGEIQWPVPEKATVEGSVSYQYEHEVVLLVPLKISSAAKAGLVELGARVDWLECDVGTKCVKGGQDVSATLNIGSEAKPTADAALLEQWKQQIPKEGSSLGGIAAWEKPPGGDSRPIVIQWSAPQKPDSADFFPFESNGYAIGAASEFVTPAPDIAQIRKTVTKSDDDWPKKIGGLIVQKTSAGEVAFEVNLEIQGPGKVVPSGTISQIAGNTQGNPTFLKMLIFAFLGGLILNIMPCVFPVIALKIFGFVQQSHDEPRRVFKLGLIYGLGVLASFLVMAVLVIAIKQAGGSASWGMQFKNPQISVGFIALVVLIALNLFGVFEVNLGGGTMGAAGQLASKHGAAGAFFNGILATILATPCTAPILASALGFAFAQPPFVVLLFFLTIGLGLAAPYVLLSWKPGWLKFLPRPGAWMEKFKVAMGFPMLATAVWIFWFTAPRFGEDGVIWIGFFLIGLAFAVWIWGAFVQRSSKRRGLAMVICAAVLVASYAYTLENNLHWRSPGKSTSSVQWQPWSADAVAKARSEGRPALVDFTAKWCLTCNKFVKPVVDNRDVRKKLDEINGVALLADYSDYPEEMGAEIKRFHSDGAVPLVLVYPRDVSKPPVVLPTIPSRQEILDALTEAAK